MKLYIAREGNGNMWIYDTKPYKDGGYWNSAGNCYLIDRHLLPKVTIENSPRQVEIKLVKKTPIMERIKNFRIEKLWTPREKFWISREKYGGVCLYDTKPYRDEEHWITTGNYYLVDGSLFPEVTFENSPQQVELKLL